MVNLRKQINMTQHNPIFIEPVTPSNEDQEIDLESLAAGALRNLETQRVPSQCVIVMCFNFGHYLGGMICREHAMKIWEDVEVNESQGSKNIRLAQTKDELRKAQELKELAKAKAAEVGRNAGTIYYIQVADRVKIGFTTNLQSRSKAYPPNSTLLATHPGTRQTETDMHRRFNRYLEHGREWFSINPELTEHIEEVKSKYPQTQRLHKLSRPSRNAASVKGGFNTIG